MPWRDILNSEIDAESPITESLITALRDNVEALANNDSGSPDFPATSLVAGSGNLYARSQRFSAGHIGDQGSDYYIYLEVTIDNTLGQSIDGTVYLDWSHDSDNPDGLRVRNYHTGAWNTVEFWNQTPNVGYREVDITLVSGSNRITFEINDGITGQYTDFSGNMTVRATWL